MIYFFVLYSIFFTYGCFTVDKSDKKIDRHDLLVILLISVVGATLCSVAIYFMPPVSLTLETK